MPETRKVLISEELAGHTAGWVMEHSLEMTRRERGRAKFRPDGIRVNGIRCRVTQVLKAGDCLEIRTEKEEASRTPLPAERRGASRLPGICYEDAEVLIVNKPAGMPMHPVGCHQGDTLTEAAALYLWQTGGGEIPRSIGRLDKETSGAVVFAKSRMGAARLQRQREEGRFQKVYLALAEGFLEEKKGTIDLPLKNTAKEGKKERMEASPAGMRAVTHYEVLGEGKDCTLLRVTLDTGRTHQIRVHMAALGHPLLGDSLYGSGPCGALFRAALHAAEVSFRAPFGRETHSFFLPLPQDFRTALREHRKEKQ